MLGAVVLNLAFGEVLVRVLALGDVSLSRATFFEFDPDAGWIGLANVDARYELPGGFDVRVQCNSPGLRDEEHADAKPAGGRRIVCIGDSFCWGYGVEADEMVSSRVEQLLPGSETINFGANGYSTVQELVRLESDGMRYGPDWVVLLFCWNDLGGNLSDKDGGRPIAALDSAGKVQIVNRPVRKPWKSPIGQWIRHHLRLYECTEYAIKATRECARERRRAAELATARAADSAQPPATTRSVAATPPVQPRTPADGEETDDDFTDIELFAPPSTHLDHAWEVARQLLRQVQALCEANGARLLVLAIPDLPGMSALTLKNIAAAAGAPIEQIDPDRPQLGEICANLGVPFVDPAAAFRATQVPAQLYLENNRHWNAQGHRIVAEAIAAKIAELEK